MVDSQRQAPTALLPGKGSNTHCTIDWKDPMAGLEVYGKSRPHRDSKPGPSSPYHVAMTTEPSRPNLNKLNNV